MHSKDNYILSKRKKQKPFLPSLTYDGLSKPSAYNGNINLSPKKKEVIATPEDIELMQAAMVDAETGEKLHFSKAKWTPKEGRLSLSAQTILDMGTGKLDIKNRVLENQGLSSEGSSSLYRKPLRSPHKPHKLVDKFLQDGPLTPMYHILWNPITNEIENPLAVDSGEILSDHPSTAQLLSLSYEAEPYSTSTFARTTDPPALEGPNATLEVSAPEPNPFNQALLDSIKVDALTVSDQLCKS